MFNCTTRIHTDLRNETQYYESIRKSHHRDMFLGFVILISTQPDLSCVRTRGNMSGKAPSKDEALEALDFIVNVLKEHEKDLDRLISELGTVAGQLGDSGELNCKVRKIEDKLSGVQNDVSNLVKSFSSVTPERDQSAAMVQNTQDDKPEYTNLSPAGTLALLFQCKQWDDFQRLADQAQTVSFTFKDSEKTMEVSALKNNQVISFSGELPNLSVLIKMYLSMQLKISEKRILQGEIAVG